MPDPGDVVFVQTKITTVEPIQRVSISFTMRVLTNEDTLGLVDFCYQVGSAPLGWSANKPASYRLNPIAEEGFTVESVAFNVSTGEEATTDLQLATAFNTSSQGVRSPLQLTMPLTLRTGRRGRSYVGRILAPVPERPDFVSNQSLLPANAWRNLQAACANVGVFDGGRETAELVVWSRKLSGSEPAVFKVTSVDHYRMMGVSSRRGYFR